MIISQLKDILDFLKEQRGFDFSGYRHTLLERRIQKRIFATNTSDYNIYLNLLKKDPEELDHLLDVLTINVSQFFRDSNTFDCINKNVLPELINNSITLGEKSLRIWSAGCSAGEEPYSMAILIKEQFKKEETQLSNKIFATDIDQKVLKSAIEGNFEVQSLHDTKFYIVKNYFTQQGAIFKINQDIKDMVQFSMFDLLSNKQSVPPESIFGGFDIVLCRNVLIYFNVDHQNIIFTKLYKSLNKNGILILGESELPVQTFKNKFTRINSCCKVYKKTG